MKQRIGVLKKYSILLFFLLAICLYVYEKAYAQNDDHIMNESGCTVDILIDLDKANIDAVEFPLLKVQPHIIKADECKTFAELLFGDATFYETSFAPPMTKSAAETKILKLEQLNNDEVITDIYGKSQLELVKNVLCKTLEELKKTSPLTNYDNTRENCKWEYMPQSYYLSNGVDAIVNDGNNVIMAYVENGPISHKVWATNRDENDYRIQNIYVYPNSEYLSPLDIETLHMIRMLCGYQKPSDIEVKHVVEKASDIVESIEIGEWTIIDSKVEAYKYWRNPEDPVYVINITAVPSYGGINSLHVKQLESLKSNGTHASNYYYSEFLLTFSPNGELIEATLTSPIDTVSVVEANANVIDLQKSIDILTAYIQKWGATILRAESIKAKEGYMVNTIIDDVELGFARVKAEDGSNDFFLIPALQFSGEYTVMHNDEIVYSYRNLFGEDYQFAVINLIDGSIITEES